MDHSQSACTLQSSIYAELLIHLVLDTHKIILRTWYLNQEVKAGWISRHIMYSDKNNGLCIHNYSEEYSVTVSNFWLGNMYSITTKQKN
jgi:hypothetical protein